MNTDNTDTDEDNLGITDEILRILVDKSEQDEAAIRTKIEEILNRDKTKCNKCGTSISTPGNHWNSIQAKISWGYESTGKDGDCDIWNLCETCTQEFRSKYIPGCCQCRRTIPEVMAKLDFLNPHCSYYGDYEAAQNAFKNKELRFGLAFAEIEGRVICEECYEELLGSFTLPLTRVDCGGEKQEACNRLTLSRIYKSTVEDSLSTHYRAWICWEELLEIKKNLATRPQKITRLTYRSEDESNEFIQLMRKDEKDWEPSISAQTGDNQYFGISISWLRELAAKENKNFDPTKLNVTNMGELLHFGEFTVETKQVMQEFRA